MKVYLIDWGYNNLPKLQVAEVKNEAPQNYILETEIDYVKRIPKYKVETSLGDAKERFKARIRKEIEYCKERTAILEKTFIEVDSLKEND